MLNSKYFLPLLFLAVSSIATASLNAQATRPDAEKKLAHDIYKEFIEIQSAFTTGSTTPVAEAAAARLKAAGFSDSDIFVGGANPTSSSVIAEPAS